MTTIKTQIYIHIYSKKGKKSNRPKGAHELEPELLEVKHARVEEAAVVDHLRHRHPIHRRKRRRRSGIRDRRRTWRVAPSFPVKSGRGAGSELGIKRMGLVHVCRCSRRCVNLDRRIGSVDEAGNSSCQGRVVFGPGANLFLGKNLILEGWIMDLENWAEPQLNIHFFVWARPVLRRVLKWAISIFIQILTRQYGFIFEI